MTSNQRVIIIGFLALLVLGVGLAAYLLFRQQQNIDQQRISTNATAQAQAAIATDQAMAAATQTEITAAQAASATTQAGTATAQAANATTQAEIATAQAASATPQAGTATAQAVTAMLQSKTATAQAATATPQAQVAAAQAVKATLQAENAAALIVTATVQAAAATLQAATATAQVGAATALAAKSTSQAAAAEALAATVTAQVATITVEKAATATVQAAIATAQAATATAQAATATAQAATATAQAEEARKVRQFISGISPLPTIQATAVYYSARTAPDRTDYVTGARLTCVAKDYNISDHFSDVIAMKSDTAALWPGAVVQTKSLRNGVLTQVNSRRMPGTIQMDLPVSPKESVEEPSQASVAKALESLLPLQSTAPIASMEYNVFSTVSLAHAGLKLGIMPASFKNQTGIGAGVGAATSQSQSHVVVQFYQRYYTVTFTPRDQMSFFRNAKVENLKNQMGDGNPPAYISSVEYGRMLIVMFSSTSSSQDLEAAVNYRWGKEKPVGVGIQARSDRILGQATIQIIAEGGSAKDAAQILTADDFERRLKEYIEQGVNVSRSAPGVPLRFRVSYLTDNTVVSIGDMVSGTTEDCTPHPLPDSQFMVTLSEIGFSRGNWLLDFPAGIHICFDSWIDVQQQKIPIEGACPVLFIDDQQPKPFGSGNPMFSVPSYNGSCFDINANFEQAIVQPVVGIATKHQIGTTKRISICYRDGQWIPPVRPMLVNYQGITLTVIFDLKLYDAPQNSPHALIEESSIMF